MSEITDDVDVKSAEQQAAAAKRSAADDQDAAATAQEQQYIDALLFEREGYARYGRDDRVAEVDEQLRLRGVKPPAAASRTATPRRGRTAG